MKHVNLTYGAPWSGLVAGPLSWMLNTQVNYSLVEWFCSAGWNLVPAIAAVFTLTSLAGGAISWFVWPHHERAGMRISEQDGHPHQLVRGISVAAGLLFALVIALQGVAGLIVGTCQR
jgi:hypothetical protein